MVKLLIKLYLGHLSFSSNLPDGSHYIFLQFFQGPSSSVSFCSVLIVKARLLAENNVGKWLTCLVLKLLGNF